MNQLKGGHSMIELSKACVKQLETKDAVLMPYYDTSDPRYFDKGKKKMADTKKKPAKKKAVKKVIKKPPSLPIKSIQHDLFSDFLTNDVSEVSNTVEYWERIPKYFLSPQEQKSLRTAEGLAKPYTQEYILRGQNGEPLPYKVRVQPALIEQDNGEFMAFFPTKSEEIIEEVLKKIFTEQNLGIHDARNSESWVRFSYSMINKELRKNKCSRTHQQIKHSLEVMSKCVLTVFEEGEEIYSNPIINNYIKVDRKKYLEYTKALHVAQLSVFISHAVNTLQYRQFNLKRLTSCKEQLSGWILRRLIERFTYASLITTHDLYYSSMKAASLLLRSSREIDNRIKVIKALEELQENGTIYSYEIEEKREGRKIVDVKYRITPSSEFSSEQKAANKRANIIEQKAVKNDLQIVDKSKSK